MFWRLPIASTMDRKHCVYLLYILLFLNIHIYTHARRQFVRLGEWNTSSAIDCVADDVCADPPLDIPVHTTHFRSFDIQWIWTHNVGIIKLVEQVQYTEWISPICLPAAKFFYEYRFGSRIGHRYTLAGFNENTCTYTRKRFNVNPFKICLHSPYLYFISSKRHR